MPQLINLGRELLRINTQKQCIEYSTTAGRSWVSRYTDSRSCGTFIDLLPWKGEILAITTKGLYYSTTEGRSWVKRCEHSLVGEFYSLQDGGAQLLADTARGLQYSTTNGRSWIRR